MDTINYMEKLLGLGGIRTERAIPGTQQIEGREFCYVAAAGQEKFDVFFRKLIRHVSPPIPTNGGAVIEGCKITLPNCEVLQAISYKGDIEGWRLQLERGAVALNVELAKIVGDIVVFDDARSFRGCKNFCVNGHLAGNCRIARNDDDRSEESRTQGIAGQPAG